MNGDEDTHVLVISAQSGGCSGYLYDMKIIEQPDEKGFQKIKIDDIKIFVHNIEAMHAFVDGSNPVTKPVWDEVMESFEIFECKKVR